MAERGLEPCESILIRSGWRQLGAGFKPEIKECYCRRFESDFPNFSARDPEKLVPKGIPVFVPGGPTG